MREFSIISPLSGKFLPIEQVPDEVFATKVLGDGIAIVPSDNILCAPCSGKISQLHKSHHAVTIESENGQQVLLHIGINTVNLKGEGFKPLVKEGDSVTIGQGLIEFNQKLIEEKGLSAITIMLLLESEKLSYKFNKLEQLVSGKTALGSVSFNVKNETANEIMLNNEKAYESVPFFVRLPSGMHARPAGQLAEIAKKYNSTIEIVKDGKVANITSIISVLGLEIEENDEIVIVAVGSDSEEATKAILKYLVQREEEEIETFSKEHVVLKDTASTLVKSDERTLVGVGASEGIVIGKVTILKNEKYNYEEKSQDSATQREKLEKAQKQAYQDVLNLESNLQDKSKIAIFAAHREMINDPEITEDAVELIEKGYTAAYAWNTAIEERAKRLESLKNELIAGRANDIRDIGERVLRAILGLKTEVKSFNEDTILIAEDLTPSDLIQIEQSKVLGFCTTTGGATSHVAILARSMGITAIAGIEKRALDLKEGTEVILDGDQGSLRLSPSQEEREEVVLKQEKIALKKELALRNSQLEATTKDGTRVEVVANIGGISDAKKSVEIGGEGVGLLRSEFLFLDRDNAPSEKEQLDTYQEISDLLGDKTLVIRTLDIGGDKALHYLPLPAEENPFLGVRGIRLCLKKQEIFREQLRAILNVKTNRPINIMFPMVGQLSELREAKAILNEERAKLGNPTVHVGIMIEVPSAAVMAEQFAKEVDFFSIGTNDLTQYALAMDRGHNELAKSVDGLHPAVLNLINMTVKAAKKHGKWVGVCGGIASDSKAIPVLIGLGIDELSLSIPNIPMIKSLIRELNKSECEKIIPQILGAESASEVRDIVVNNWPSLY